MAIDPRLRARQIIRFYGTQHTHTRSKITGDDLAKARDFVPEYRGEPSRDDPEPFPLNWKTTPKLLSQALVWFRRQHQLKFAPATAASSGPSEESTPVVGDVPDVSDILTTPQAGPSWVETRVDQNLVDVNQNLVVDQTFLSVGAGEDKGKGKALIDSSFPLEQFSSLNLSLNNKPSRPTSPRRPLPTSD